LGKKGDDFTSGMNTTEKRRQQGSLQLKRRKQGNIPVFGGEKIDAGTKGGIGGTETGRGGKRNKERN